MLSSTGRIGVRRLHGTLDQKLICGWIPLPSPFLPCRRVWMDL